MTINRLTKLAAARFTALADETDDAEGRALATQRRIKSVEDQRRNLTASDTETEAALTAEIERLSVIRDRQREGHHHQSRLVTAIRTWLAGLSQNVELMDHDESLTIHDENIVKPDGNEATCHAVDRCRAELFRLRDARASVQRSVPPIDELYVAIDAHVVELAARGCPTMTVDGGKLTIKHKVDNNWNGGLAKDAVAMTAWLAPDLLRDRLHAQIDEMREVEIKRGVSVMTTQHRDRRLIELDEHILRQERAEDYYIELAEQAYDTRISRRDDADPRAVLRVFVAKRQPARATA